MHIISSVALLLFISSVAAAVPLPAAEVHVDCTNGSDLHGDGSASRPFKTPEQAREHIRTLRSSANYNYVDSHSGLFTLLTVNVAGWCELASTLVLDNPALDSNVAWTGSGADAGFSGGVQLSAADTNTANGTAITQVNLKKYNFSTSNLGKLSGRGYSGGSACIDLNNFEASAAELFYRPHKEGGAGAGAGAGDVVEDLETMRVARFPNVAGTPATSDWLEVAHVGSVGATGTPLGVTAAVAARLSKWSAELEANPGAQAWTHGLWSWNWADSHRPVTAIAPDTETLVVGNDDINRDVNPIKVHGGGQGGNYYVYNLRSELDGPGEYYVDAQTATLSYIPPLAVQPPPSPPSKDEPCTWNVTISRSDTKGAWHSLLVPGGVNDAFKFSGCSASGPMGLECTRMKPRVHAGAHVLVNNEGTAIGEGVCCNGVDDSVISAVRLKCSTPPPPPPPPPSPAPPAPPAPPLGSYHVSRLATVVSLLGVSNVSFTRIEIRFARGAGVSVVNSLRVVLDSCTLSNHGMMAVNITGGLENGVRNSEVGGNGDGGVVLDGGDRLTLTPSNHFVEDTSLHHNQRWLLNYAPHVFMGGVGQRVLRSRIFAGPQIGVFMQGNDHSVADSVLHDLGQQCSDCGAFYAGREWTYRGNKLLNNTWYRIESIWGAVSAVYLDDQLSSVTIDSNTFDHVSGFVLELGGGRNNIFTNNIINGTGSVHFDNRGHDGNGCAHAGAMPYEFLARVPYKTAAVWSKYQDLPNLLDDEPCTPKYNQIEGNTLCGGVTSLGFDVATATGKWGSFVKNNTVRAQC